MILTTQIRSAMSLGFWISATAGAGLLSAAALPAQSPAGLPPEPSHVEARARPDRETTVVGGRIGFKVRLKNISNEVIWVVVSRPPENVIELSAVDADKHPVPLTPSGEAFAHGIRIGGGGPVLLRPGQEAVFDLDASKYFNITKAGTYHITARYSGPIRTSAGDIPARQILAAEHATAEVDVRIGE